MYFTTYLMYTWYIPCAAPSVSTLSRDDDYLIGLSPCLPGVYAPPDFLLDTRILPPIPLITTEYAPRPTARHIASLYQANAILQIRFVTTLRQV